jgi:hypothetical protein
MTSPQVARLLIGKERTSLDSYYAHTRLPTINDSRSSWDFRFTNKEEELKKTLEELMEPEETTFRPSRSVTSSAQTILPKSEQSLNRHTHTPSDPAKARSRNTSPASHRTHVLKQLIHHLETDAYHLIESQAPREALDLLLRAQQSINAVYYRHHPQHVYG